MKRVICREPGILEQEETFLPDYGPEEVLVKIKKIGICGTDLHAFEGTQPFFSYPRVLGHELACEIASLGDNVTGFKIGDVVTFIPYFPCFKCIACQSGKPHCCANIRGAGVHIDGGMAEYMSVPAYSLIPGNGLETDELALVEPMAIGAHAVRITGIGRDEYVIVAGAGPIGLGVMAFARYQGAKVIAMDVVESRLEFSRKFFNTDFQVNPMENPLEKIREITGGDMATVVIDATGNKKAIENSLNYLAHGGRITLVGLQREPFSFSHPEFHKRETTLRSSRNATTEDFKLAVECMKSGFLNVKPLITNRIGFSNLADHFKTLLDPEQKVVKAMVEMEEQG